MVPRNPAIKNRTRDTSPKPQEVPPPPSRKEIDQHTLASRFSATGCGSLGLVKVPSRSMGKSTAARFTDPRLRAAIVDRLTFGGSIVETGTDSYLLATTRARAEQQAVG